MTAGRKLNVLFLCTGNTARSILSEAVLAHMGGGRFNAFSAGSMPKGEIHPLTVEVLAEARIPLPEGARSKSWDEYAAPDAPGMDLVITVCDNAKGEVCPIWPGRPANAHWSYPDPAAVEGGRETQIQAFRNVLKAIRHRVGIFVSLKLDTLTRPELEARAQDIGRTAS